MKLSIKNTLSLLLPVGLALIILGGWFNFTLADKGYTPLTVLPGTTNSEGQVTIDSYIPGIFNLTIGIAGVLAVLMILIGGVEYITTDAIQGKSDGKSRISNALWGLVLVLVSWILLHTINPKLTVFDLTIKESVSSQSAESDNDSSDSSVNDSSSDSSRWTQDSDTNIGDFNTPETSTGDLPV